MLKYADNPPMLSPQLDGFDHARTIGPWRVAHTKARAEKAFAWDLLQRDVPYYLPMYEQTRVSGGRKRRVLKPLFSGYVFFAGDAETRYEAMTTGKLCQVLEPNEPARLITELAAIQQALLVGPGLSPHPLPVVGQRCRVTAGPLQGMEGTVIERRNRALFVLSVEMLNQAAVLEVEADLLEPID